MQGWQILGSVTLTQNIVVAVKQFVRTVGIWFLSACIRVHTTYIQFDVAVPYLIGQLALSLA